MATFFLFHVHSRELLCCFQALAFETLHKGIRKKLLKNYLYLSVQAIVFSVSLTGIPGSQGYLDF